MILSVLKIHVQLSAHIHLVEGLYLGSRLFFTKVNIDLVMRGKTARDICLMLFLLVVQHCKPAKLADTP